jgi:hypothetical protein
MMTWMKVLVRSAMVCSDCAHSSHCVYTHIHITAVSQPANSLRHTDTLTEAQANRHTGTQVHRHTGTQAHTHTGTQAHRYIGT